MSSVIMRDELPKLPSWRDAIQACWEVYNEVDGGAAGCCLHCTLDDGNLRDSDVAYAIGLARERKHQKCEAAALLVLRMSWTQRFRITRNYGLYCHGSKRPT